MSNTIDFRQPHIVFEYSKGSHLRSVHADGVIGGSTPSGYIHLTFYTEQPMLPTKHVFRLNPDGSFGAEISDDRSPKQPIVRDMQASVLITASTAEVLRNWLDQYINNLRARMAGPTLGASKPTPVSTVQNPERPISTWLSERITPGTTDSGATPRAGT